MDWDITNNGLLYSVYPGKDPWALTETVYEMIKLNISKDSESHTRVLIIDALPHVQNALSYLSFIDKVPLIVNCHLRGGEQDIPFERPINYYDEVFKSHFIIKQRYTIYELPEKRLHLAKWKEYNRIFLENESQFLLVGEVDSPVGDILVYKKLLDK
jgi:hypothetical protein